MRGQCLTWDIRHVDGSGCNVSTSLETSARARPGGGGLTRSLTVLLADADPAARHVLRRVLLREFKSIVIEADNGIAVLEALDGGPIDVLILDLKIPGLSGLDVLRDIRHSPRLRGLPVLIVTEKKDEVSIKTALALGVADYVLKDQHQAVIVERMRRVFSSERVLTQLRAQSHAAQRAIHSLGFTVIVIDEDPDFRHFCTDVLRSKYEVVTTPSGAQAMSMSMMQPPNAILVGSEIGTMSQESFARRIRHLDIMSDTKLVAVVPKNRVEAATALGLFDCVAVRSFVPETFVMQFEQILRPPGVLAKVATTMPGFRSQTISAVEQVFGMMLGTEVNILPAAPSIPPPGLSVQIPVTFEELGGDIVVGARVSERTGRELSARMLQCTVDELPDDPAGGALSEILNMVGGRVQNGLTTHGLRAHLGLPVTGAVSDPLGETIMLGFGFDSVSGEPQEFAVCISERLTVVVAEAAA